MARMRTKGIGCGLFPLQVSQNHSRQDHTRLGADALVSLQVALTCSGGDITKGDGSGGDSIYNQDNI